MSRFALRTHGRVREAVTCDGLHYTYEVHDHVADGTYLIVLQHTSINFKHATTVLYAGEIQRREVDWIAHYLEHDGYYATMAYPDTRLPRMPSYMTMTAMQSLYRDIIR